MAKVNKNPESLIILKRSMLHYLIWINIALTLGLYLLQCHRL
jgi:hypothetical protein